MPRVDIAIAMLFVTMAFLMTILMPVMTRTLMPIVMTRLLLTIMAAWRLTVTAGVLGTVPRARVTARLLRTVARTSIATGAPVLMAIRVARCARPACR